MSPPTPNRHGTIRPTEAQCQTTIIAAARLAGWRVHAERPAQMGSGKWSTPIQGDSGFPDLTLSRGGQLVIVELKRAPNKVEPEQQVWLDQLAKVPGVSAFVVWVPEEKDQFIKALQRR